MQQVHGVVARRGAALSVLCGLAIAASGQTQTDKLLASDGATGQAFGMSADISGDTLVVGARWGNGAVSSCGCAYIFHRDGASWSEIAKIGAADGHSGDDFGISAAIHGDILVVGAHGDDDHGADSGSAYVFMRTGDAWNQVAKLNASDAQAGDAFGVSVETDGQQIIVGAYGEDALADRSGAAYIFERVGDEWTEVAKLTASDGSAEALLGSDVAIQGETAIVGAYSDDAIALNAGAAYVFRRVDGAWAQAQKLAASDPSPNQTFGVTVAMFGEAAVIGAFGDSAAATRAGAAYAFDRVGGVWTQSAKLVASDASPNKTFGCAVDLNAATILVGAKDEDTPTTPGAAYAFERVGGRWVQACKILPSDGAVGDSFARSVALAGHTTVIGANRDDGWTGSAYVFDLPAPCTPADLAAPFGVLDLADVNAFVATFLAGCP